MSNREIGLIALTFGLGTLALCLASLWVEFQTLRKDCQAILRSIYSGDNGESEK